MTKVAVTLAEGFEEIEAVTVVDVLRRAGFDVVTLGVGGTEIRGAHGLAMRADKTLASAKDDAWDLVVLPGGMPGTKHLRESRDVEALVKRQAASGKVAAICAAPTVLGQAGALTGKKATCYPGFEADLGGAKHTTDRVVRDGNVVTSRGPGTAMDFSLELVAWLAGEAKAREVAGQLLTTR